MPKKSSPIPQLSPDKSRSFPSSEDLKRRSIRDKKLKSPQSGEHRYQESERENDDVNYATKPTHIYPILDESLEDEDQDDRMQREKYTSENKMTEHMSNKIYPDINADEKPTYLSYVKKILILLSVIIIGFVISFFKPSKNVGSTEIDVQQLMQNLKSQFKNQPEITFRIIKRPLARVLDKNSEPSAPAVITLLAEREAEDIAQKFALHIAKEIAPEKYILINEALYKNRNPNEIKLEIDTKIKSEAQNNSCNVIVIDKFQKIPFQAAMIFHNYCDHETAPLKRAVYLLLLYVDEIILENATHKYLDALAMSQMRTIWHEAHRDKIDSLITRITVSVAYIKNG